METMVKGGRGELSPWWLVLCLVGVDYFSTLAYLPSLAVQAAGTLAPLGALVVVFVTLAIALPVYWYVVGRSPHGRGGIGVIERSIHGWKGKLLVLVLLAFVATDFVVTQNLSTADAAEHLRGNPWFASWLDRLIGEQIVPRLPLDQEWCRWLHGLCDRQLVLTLVLSLITFAFWMYWRRVSPRVFLRWAAVVVLFYLTLNALVIGSGVYYLATAGRPLLHQWMNEVHAVLPKAGQGGLGAGSLLALALAVFPHMALGLSGFELSMAVAPLVKGAPSDADRNPAGRIRNMRKLLVTAAVIMAVGLVTSISLATILVPAEAYLPRGTAVHRALAYLAHGGTLADGRSAAALNPLFGPAFGAVYDVCSVWILCLAGASVAIALHDFIPDYLKRLGMEMEWAHQIGLKLRFFNVILLVVAVLFRARIEALQWVYTTSVLTLLANGSLAGWLEVRERCRGSKWRIPAELPLTIAFTFFLAMAVMTVLISRAGIEIALAFGVGILITSALSRWMRSTELRFSGFRYADDATQKRWDEMCRLEFQVLVPHRPGACPRGEKQLRIRKQHRIADDVPMIFIEAQLGDPSDFFQAPLMRIEREGNVDVIVVTGCVSIAHVIAAIALQMSKCGRPPEIHFGWSNERPLAANLNFLMFGEGNIPWMVRELILRATPDDAHQPQTFIG